MVITILTDNPRSWMIPYALELKHYLEKNHTVYHTFSVDDIVGGDIMIMLSCEKIIQKEHLLLHKSNIVVHPSKLPQGKGWSPLAWQILEGQNKIPVSLFEACESVDAGDIYLVDYLDLEGHELNDEIKHKQGLLTLKMVKQYVDQFDHIKATPQAGEESFYAKRGKKENKVDINKTIAEQFDLFRIADNERYPLNFSMRGHEYTLKIYKL